MIKRLSVERVLQLILEDSEKLLVMMRKRFHNVKMTFLKIQSDFEEDDEANYYQKKDEQLVSGLHQDESICSQVWIRTSQTDEEMRVSKNG